MAAHGRAREKGCGQTLWLFGPEKYVTEAGASNIFVIWKRKDTQQLELVTSSLDTGVILPGVTRQSVLEIARERLAKNTASQWSELEPLEVVERPLTMDEIAEAHTDGRLVECFVSGTAVSLHPDA
jgi:branched-chain amino acid aminotransferase